MNRFLSRKFLLAVLLTLLSFVALLMDKIGEQTWVIITVGTGGIYSYFNTQTKKIEAAK